MMENRKIKIHSKTVASYLSMPLLLKFLCSVFKSLHTQHFIWCHIPYPNRIKKFSNYQGKTWYSSIFVLRYIFLNFLFVIVSKMWTWMMSLISIWLKRSTYWVTKALAWTHLCFWLIIDFFFFLTVNRFFWLVISSFISRYIFLWEWGISLCHE